MKIPKAADIIQMKMNGINVPKRILFKVYVLLIGIFPRQMNLGYLSCLLMSLFLVAFILLNKIIQEYLSRIFTVNATDIG